MNCKCLKNASTLERVQHCLKVTMSVDMDELEQLVEQAHKCDPNQIEDPPEPFAISRQALRMFWYFRRNLDAVQTDTEQS